MNTLFRSLQPSGLLFFDVEAVRKSKVLDPKSEEFKHFQYLKRDRETDLLPTEQETIELYGRTAALNSVYNTIVNISIGVIVSGEYIKVKAITGDEKDIILEFFKIITSKPNYTLISFNGLSWDWPLIERKAMIHNIKVPDRFASFGMKSWTMSDNRLHYDMLQVWKGFGHYSDSLADVAFALGISDPKTDLKGSAVSDLFWSNPKKNLPLISQYCNGDVIALINILLRMQGKNTLSEIKK